MADCFLGEIRVFAGNFAPMDWALCNGQSLPINQNDALFALLGTTYGGDGQVNFNLPDLRGRAPLHRSANYPMGSVGGCEQVSLSMAQVPQHNHPFPVSGEAGSSTAPLNKVPAMGAIYTTTAGNAEMAAGSIAVAAGGAQPHENMQPWVAMSYIIALNGLFPTQS